MRFLLPTIGIAVLVVVRTALQIHFAPKRVAEAGVIPGIPVQEFPANYVKTLPEQEVPLP
jgi:hypothetical protein